ncbi:hypothetical protein CXG81DRAFT_24555 [Caulochytrium protostelioides]|uniref:Uncharacterized protein n=1 Tax=Caulochytrium protostelioides TaxID=1555241 RepID=A0A4P9XBH1_9FUNG|nr:hypothetical protein CXG81DRAFT_24555 [Caulochytrium protostelioides]|eukprot:RKP02767.1 hypothetical protein CXG81DRAFT_24555 [Caulochytrium protostelioides]
MRMSLSRLGLGLLVAVPLGLIPSVLGGVPVYEETWESPQMNYCGTLGACNQIITGAKLKSQLYSLQQTAIMYLRVIQPYVAEVERLLTTTTPTATNAAATTTTTGTSTAPAPTSTMVTEVFYKYSVAGFFPMVNSYAKLTIPDSWPLLDTSINMPVNVSAHLFFGGKMFNTTSRLWSASPQLYVPSRSLQVTVVNGNVTSFDWTPTSCTLSLNEEIDGICSDTCLGYNCTINVFVGWSGTDSGGHALDSIDRDVWNLQEAF